MSFQQLLDSVQPTAANASPVNTIPGAQIKSDVTKLLTSYIGANATHAERLDPSYGELWRSIQDLLDAGGKRLRPYLVVRSYGAWGGNDYQNILWIAAAYELLHISLLIHDDIIDRDYERHGQLNLAGKYRHVYGKLTSDDEATHYANGTALLGGDLCLSGAYQLTSMSGFEPHQKTTCLQALGNAMFTVAGGELLDSESAMHSPASVDTRKIAIHKTAGYSFISPLLTGAHLAGAPADDIVRLEAYGTALGIAYQLSDDILGVFGDPAQTGKSNLSDLREGKRTPLIQRTLELAQTDDHALLTRYLGRPDLTSAQAEAMREIIERSGARQAIAEELLQLCEQAQQELEAMHIDTKSKQSFSDLIIKVRDRNA